MSIVVIAPYFSVLAVLAALGLHRLVAVLISRGYREPPGRAPSGEAPFALVQLPMYDEMYVAERALRAAAALRYPPGRWRIQVLDDSRDGTRAIVDRVAAELLGSGAPIEVVRRPGREGYKAGALAHGLDLCPEAEVVAIFDADFVPEPCFLERTVAILVSAPELGLVQARWGHLNRDASLLTRAQGVFLDGHFAVEHAARAHLGHPFNFNGTAGLWRRAAIEQAGGWQSDTITEDLDISYRAQLRGFRFAYAHGVVAPAELPESWTAFRAQQARWVRGSVETSRKLLGKVLRHRAWSPWARLDAAVHLLGNGAYLLMAALALLLPAALVVREEMGWRVPGGRELLSALDLSLLGAGTLALVAFYAVALRRTGASSARRSVDVAFALCVGAGMSFSNAAEVVRGLRSRSSEFVRTPKKGDGAPARAYRARAAHERVALELALAAYHGAAVVYAIEWRVWGALPFLLLYMVGFSAVGLGAAREALASGSALAKRVEADDVGVAVARGESERAG